MQSRMAASGAVGAGQEILAEPRADRLSLVLPAWNEQESIRQAIREADAALAAIAADYEILVVDDGSTDRTAAIVREEASGNPRVRLLQHGRNRGYGAALRTGFEAAAMELVAFTDADCQFDLHDLDYVLPLTRRYDIVCGYRIERQDPARRRFFSWGYNTLVKLLLGSQVHDIDCALKVFRREQVQTILPECKNFFVNTEMLTKARLQGLSIVEVGVRHRPRAAGTSKVSISDIPKTLSVLLPFWWSRLLFPARDPQVGEAPGRFWTCLVLLALVAGALLFPNLSYPLIKPDEWRYAEIGREMLTSGDWLVPRVHHEPYLDKPPLYYWLTASSLAIFGKHEWAARLVPALAAFLTVLLTYGIGRRSVGHRAAFLGALALSLTASFVQCGRFIVLDSVFGLFVAMALLSAHEAVRGKRFRWTWWLVSATLCALAVMTKGPAGLALAAPPVIAYGWLRKNAARPRLLPWIAYLCLVAVLAAPWYLAIMARDPRLVRHFFIEHHLQRFFSNSYHANPFWYYVPVLLIGCLPWSLLLFPACRFLFSRSLAIAKERFPAMGFMLLAAGWCILFFSLSRGKLPPYIVPAMPALALVLGCCLHRMLGQLSWATFLASHPERADLPRKAVAVLALTWLGVGAFAWSKNLVGTTEYLLEASFCVGCMVAATVWRRKLSPRAAWGLCALVVVAVIYQSAHDLVPAWARQRSPLAGREVARLLEDPDTAVAALGHELCSLPLVLERDDVPNFTWKPLELTKYFQSNVRTVVVAKGDLNMQILRLVVPPGMEIRPILQAEGTHVYLVQAATPDRALRTEMPGALSTLK